MRIISVAGAKKSRQLIGDAGFKSGFPMGGAMPPVISHPALKVNSGRDLVPFYFLLAGPPCTVVHESSIVLHFVPGREPLAPVSENRELIF